MEHEKKHKSKIVIISYELKNIINIAKIINFILFFNIPFTHITLLIIFKIIKILIFQYIISREILKT